MNHKPEFVLSLLPIFGNKNPALPTKLPMHAVVLHEYFWCYRRRILQIVFRRFGS